MALLGAGGVGGGGVGATCKSLMNAGFSLNRRCRGPGRREVSVLGLTAAEASGAADRPTEVSGEGRASDGNVIPLGTGWLNEAEAPTWGELDGGTAPVGASGTAERPTEVSGDGPAADAGAILIGTGRLNEAEAPTWGEPDGGTATVGASGGEGGVGLLSRAWGTIG